MQIRSGRARSATGAIRIGLVGCGGRGAGIISQALRADKDAVLVALGDVDSFAVDRCLANLGRSSKLASQIRVEGRFIGLDSYRSVIDSDVDLVILATPPAFRPRHLEASVAAGKHVYCEKPVATDVHGIRSVLRSTEEAKARDLCLMGGLSMRYNQLCRQMVDSIHQGAIGPVVGYHATFFHGEVKPMPPASARPGTMSDTEWQIRNWYNFVWLSGDGLVEQAIHSLDRMSWVLQDQPPLSCLGIGGRSVPAPDGNTYDHFSVTYQFPDHVQAVINTRQMDGCVNGVFDYIAGSQGTCIYGRGPYPEFSRRRGGLAGQPAHTALNFLADRSDRLSDWMRWRSGDDMYQSQQNQLLAAIRNARPINDGQQLAHTTLLAIMGRTAAYTGQEITWEQILNWDERLVPDVVDWHGALAVQPRAQPGLVPAGVR